MLLELALILFFAVALSYPLSKYIDTVLNAGLSFKYTSLRNFEKIIFNACGIDTSSQNWKSYFLSIVYLSLISFIFGFICLITQGKLPLNPIELEGVHPSLAFNIIISYITATNWQAYSGETTLSYFSQCVLTVLAFISTGIGISAAVAIIRGLVNQNQEAEGRVFGNFWIDFIRSVLYILLPLCIIASLIFVSQGVIQNFSNYIRFTGLDGIINTIPQGPVATQESIKLLGVNGGGFFGTNSAHPYENPTGFSNFFQMFLMILIPCALAFLYASMTGKIKHGFIIVAFMTSLLLISSYSVIKSETRPIQNSSNYHNIEGKEIRFGLTSSALFATFCATTSGSANSTIISFNPESVIYLFSSMMFGGAIFGGVGTGLCNLILFVLMAVFLAGMMAGRTPKFLGKSIEFQEIKYITIFLVIYQSLIITMLSIALMNTKLTGILPNQQSLAITQLAIAYASSTINNGLGYGSFDSGLTFLNLTLAFCMIIGRFSLIYCMFKVADSLASKNSVESRLEEVQTDSWFFAFLVFFAMLNDFLVFVPTIIIGPVIEYLVTR